MEKSSQGNVNAKNKTESESSPYGIPKSVLFMIRDQLSPSGRVSFAKSCKHWKYIADNAPAMSTSSGGDHGRPSSEKEAGSMLNLCMDNDNISCRLVCDGPISFQDYAIMIF
ncbi:uncharacterized protein A4U43_C07F34220 [Asparagus officinalis]|uniref:F-box domain-containing protein n=1 Tax=Asparagus officinalis TaxID=4686 RepID=A0A5P1EKN2_ASPOF|nr:uncharacterized protein A4U43_C07F34220 [Asparagus officinalis]